jgi:hypothetical protein
MIRGAWKGKLRKGLRRYGCGSEVDPRQFLFLAEFNEPFAYERKIAE